MITQVQGKAIQFTSELGQVKLFKVLIERSRDGGTYSACIVCQGNQNTSVTLLKH